MRRSLTIGYSLSSLNKITNYSQSCAKNKDNNHNYWNARRDLWDSCGGQASVTDTGKKDVTSAAYS